VQSANEELQSINEELETSKEEVQSTNEELATVNDELRNRNLELGQINNDVVNLIGSVSMAIVMVGSDLRIRRFTPMAEKTLNLIPADLGRPITDIKLPLTIDDLEPLVAEVIDTSASRSRGPGPAGALVFPPCPSLQDPRQQDRRRGAGAGRRGLAEARPRLC
jgi:two-component system CheB/CheR fusion protein